MHAYASGSAAPLVHDELQTQNFEESVDRDAGRRDIDHTSHRVTIGLYNSKC